MVFRIRCFFDDDEDEVGMGERTDSVSFYVESRLDPSAAETENGALDLLRKLEETERMKTIRSLSFKGVGAFPAQYAGGVIPTKRSDESLLREASKNSLAAVKLIGDTVALAIPNVSKPGDSRDSSGGSTPRPSYMKQTGVASIN